MNPFPFVVFLVGTAFGIFGGGELYHLTHYPVSQDLGALSVLTVSQGGTGNSSFTSGECLKGNGTGPLTTGSCGSGGGSGAFPFSATTNYGQVVYATSTPTLWLQAGIFASSTSHFAGFDTKSATTTTFITTFGSTTVGTVTSLFSTDATTTNLSVTASSTLAKLYGAGLATCNGGNVLTWSSGTFGCVADQTATGAANPFTWTGNYAVLNAATSSVLWGQNGINASSTSNLDVINVPSPTGTSTILNALQIGATAGDNALKLTAGRVYTASNSVGGMVNLTNTNSTGPALVIYTNNGGTSAGNLVNVRCDNTAMAHDCVKIDHDGAGDGLSIAATAAASNALSLSNTGLDHTANIAYTGSTANKGALNLTSTNTAGSVFQVAGTPIALGVAKITHNGTGDANSSLLSLDASASGYLGQGIFLDSSGGSWASSKILNLRANGTEFLTLQTDGKLGLSSSTPRQVLSVQGNALISGDLTSAANVTATGTIKFTALNAASCDVKADTNGVLSCGTDQTAAGGANPFIWTPNFGAVSAATSSVLWAQSGLQASSTSYFANIQLASSSLTTYLSPFYTKTFSYASSTQGMGTTTRSIGVAPAGMTFKSVQCDFSNFMRIVIYDSSGNRMNDLVASSTIGTVSFTTNTFFDAGKAIRLDIGTTTNINANVYGSCTYKYVFN